MSVVSNRKEEYEQLCRTIQNWNEHRLELFEISQPKENLEFEGVMRFYFQSSESDGQKVATKCIRVSSTATTSQVVEALVQKFRPDLRMLTTPSLYTLYEVHADGDERMLDKNECPLWVQLNWVVGNREGRFLLKKMTPSNGLKLLSKKDKKNKEDKRKSKNKQKGEIVEPENIPSEEQGSIARSLYTDMPESRLTMSVSHRQGDIRVLHSEPGSDNSVPVHVSADLLLPDTPCKSLLIGDKDTAAQVVSSAVSKYDIREDPSKFCLVQMTVPSAPDGNVQADIQIAEKVLDDADLPLLIYSRWIAANGDGGAIQFQLRRRASFNQNKPPDPPADLSNYPILVEVIQGVPGPQCNPRTFPLTTAQAEIGSDPTCCVCLTSGGIKQRHCVITSHDGGAFTVTPLDKAASVHVNNKQVRACSALPNSAILKLGDTDTFQFLAPSVSSSPSPVPNKPIPVPPDEQAVRRNNRQGQQGVPNMSKAFSSEDILNPPSSGSLKRPLKERAFSEYNLPGDGASHEQRNTPESDTPAVESTGGSISPANTLEWSVLPATLFFYHAKGPLLLQALILDVEGYTLQFKLGPAFALYMMARCYLSPDFQPGVSTAECKKNLVLTLKNIATNIKRAVKDNRNIAGPLAFWLANTSELLHFLKSDRQLSLLSHEYGNQLTQLIKVSYKNFTEYMLKELNVTITAFLDETSDADTEDAYLMAGAEGEAREPDVVPTTAQPQLFVQTAIYWSVSESRMRRRGRPTMGDVLFTLNSTMALLQSCRVNATLCVLVCSTLFHYISTRLFNKLVAEPGRYCSVNIGMKLGKRIDRIIAWAETQGMELPAQEHLVVILQAASLLRTPKDSSQDAQKIFSTCSHLTSLQVGTLLEHSRANEGEAVVSEAVVDKLVSLARLHTDKQLQADGLGIHLEEDINLELPFHVPEVGYYGDGLVGVPTGLQEYLESAVSAGLCKLNINGDASGSSWISPRTSDSCHSLEQLGDAVHSATLPRSLGQSQRNDDAMDSTIIVHGYSTLPRQPHDSRIVQLTITKEGSSNPLGISIIGGKGFASGDVGIFIKSMTVGGAAQMDGRLSKGDQILMVDSQSLEGATQCEAANVLRSTGKTITLTVAKHAAHYQGLQALINHPSPRNARQNMNVPEGSSHAQKAKRRQRRERERSLQYGGDHRLDSRKGEDLPEKSVAPQHVAKWLSEQRGLVHSHDDEHQSSTSTLSNIPEQERPVSPGHSSASVKLGSGERRSLERHSVSTPPVRDSTRPHDSDSSTFSSLVHLEVASTEASTRYSDYSQEEYHRQSLMTGPGSGGGVCHLLTLHNSSLPYSDAFNLSSQSALQSQSYPTIMSQQRPTAQDRLSMDVLQHTQPSSASLSGVGAVLAKVKASSAVIGGKGDAHFLLSSDLKGLEMDDIELEKQRIHLLLYEEQKEKELLSSASKENQLILEEESNEISEEESRLRKELMSIEHLITEQKKKFKDLKYNREREEKKLKENDKQLHDTIVEAALLTGDQQRQAEQKQRQYELEQRKRDLNRRIQALLGNEHNAKTKLLALECNAQEIQEQLRQIGKCPPQGEEDLGPQQGISSNGMMDHRQDDDFSEKGSDVPRPGSPSVMRESVQLLPELDTAAERQWVNPSWSSHHGPTTVLGPGSPRDVGSRGNSRVSKTMSASDLSEPSEDSDSRPAKWSVAYDNAARLNPPHTSEQHSFKSHSRDEIDDISKHAYDKPRNAGLDGAVVPPAEHAFYPPVSPQQELRLRGEGRHYRGLEPYDAAGVGRSSSAWYQSSVQQHGVQRPSSADNRSESPSTHNRPDQGPPSAYNRIDQGLASAYNRPTAGRSDQQGFTAFQNRMDPSFPNRSDQIPSGTGSRPSSAFSDHRSDLEPSRVPVSSRPDSGRLDHHYSRQTKSRAPSRSLNQSSSAENLIANTEPASNNSSRQPGTPDVVPSTRAERPSGRVLESPNQPISVVPASRERDNVLSSGNISSPRPSHGKQESDVSLPGGERMRSMTFSGSGTSAPRHARAYEQTSLQQGRTVPHPHDQVAATSSGRGPAPSAQPRSYELTSIKPQEPGRSHSSAQGRSYEQVALQQGQQAQGRVYGLQGRSSDQHPQARSYEQAPLPQGRSYDQAPLPQGRSYDQAPLQQTRSYEQTPLPQGRSYDQTPLPQGRSYDQAPLQQMRSYDQAPLQQARSYDQTPLPQGRSYEQVLLVQGKSHDNGVMPQGRSYDQAPLPQGTQGRSYEQVALAQDRAHGAVPGRPYDPATPTQRRSYEQFVLPQGKPYEQSRTAQAPILGRPYESTALPASHLQGQRTSPYERMFIGGDLSNAGRNPVGYPTKAGGHSYSRRRPDPPQMTLEDKMKHYIEGMEEPSYPDRIQRQQTEL